MPDPAQGEATAHDAAVDVSDIALEADLVAEAQTRVDGARNRVGRLEAQLGFAEQTLAEALAALTAAKGA